MREWEPHGSDLVVTRRPRINDAARDIEVRFRIAVVQRPAIALNVDGRADAESGQRAQDAE